MGNVAFQAAVVQRNEAGEPIPVSLDSFVFFFAGRDGGNRVFFKVILGFVIDVHGLGVDAEPGESDVPVLGKGGEDVLEGSGGNAVAIVGIEEVAVHYLESTVKGLMEQAGPAAGFRDGGGANGLGGSLLLPGAR